jgi:hypothetical protein
VKSTFSTQGRKVREDARKSKNRKKPSTAGHFISLRTEKQHVVPVFAFPCVFAHLAPLR